MKRMLAALVLLVLAACSPSTVPSASVPGVPAPGAAPTESAGMSSLLADVVAVAADRPAWQTVPLTDAASGAAFTLADFPEQTVWVQLISVSCANCLAQQAQLRAAREQLGEDQYRYISLSIEASDTPEMLSDYAARENFPWVFALAPASMVSQLVAHFGQAVTDSAATPHFIISPSGAVSQLVTGMKTAEQLVAELTAAAGA